MNYDGAIVLGYELAKGKLQAIAKKRLDKFIELYRKKRIRVILAGGYSIKIKKGTGPTEAAVMKSYAIKKGVKKEDIILEEDSRDTHANAYFTKKIAEKLGWKKILVTTTDINLYKIKYFFKFIYGPGYKFRFIGVPREVGKKEKSYLLKYDKKSAQVMKEMYKEQGVKPGEDKKIKKIIDKFYADKEKGWNPKTVVKVKD